MRVSFIVEERGTPIEAMSGDPTVTLGVVSKHKIPETSRTPQ